MIVRRILLVLALASYAHAGDPVPAEFVGSWTLSEQSVAKLASDCRKLRIVFTADGTLVSFSGELRFVSKISAKRQNEGFIVHHDFLEHNGKPNCQGKSPEYILSRFVQDIYFERNGALLRQYIWTKETGRFVDFVRTRST